MIQRLSHTTLMVEDQTVAKEFYIGKLGFDLRADHDTGKWRWVTVSPSSQPDLQIILMLVDAYPKLDDAGRDSLRKLMRNSMMLAAVLQISDCRKAYEELLARGVAFPPDCAIVSRIEPNADSKATTLSESRASIMLSQRDYNDIAGD